MRYVRPQPLLAGFHAEHPVPGVPALVHVGEQWAPTELEIREHEHDVWELYLQAHGVSRWRAADRAELVLRPGDCFAAPPRMPHGMTGRPSAKHHFFYAALDLAAIAEGEDGLAGVWGAASVHVAGAATMEAPFRQLVREVSIARPHQAAAVRAALLLLVIEASRLVAPRAGVHRLATHPAVERVRAVLEQHCDRAWSLAQMARIAGLSPNYLVERFRADVGMPPHAYLLGLRVARGRELLSDTDLPVGAIAAELGFCSSQHFARVFRAHAGRSPSAHRAEREAAA